MVSQFGTGVEYKDGDGGTGAWAIKPGPAAVPEVPPVPGSVVLSEDFEGALWSEITEVSGTWVATTAHSHSATTSYTNPDIGDGGSASFTIQNDAFDAQLSFWLRTDTESGFDKFQVFIDGAEVYSESGFNDWHRVAIPTGFGFLFEFRYTKDSSVSGGADACWVDDIVLGSLDTPAVPGIPARPFVYTPLKMTDDGDRLKVDIASISVADMISFASINLSAAGVTTLVAAVPGKKIRVLSYLLSAQSANAAVNVQLRSGTTVLAELRELDGTTVSYAGNLEGPAFETAAGEALNANLSVNKIVTGHLSYIEVE